MGLALWSCVRVHLCQQWAFKNFSIFVGKKCLIITFSDTGTVGFFVCVIDYFQVFVNFKFCVLFSVGVFETH